MATKHIVDRQFWLAVKILIKQYHVLNKKIFEVVITKVQKRQQQQLYDSDEDELDQQLQADAGARICEGFKICFKMLTKKLGRNILANGTLGEENLMQ